MRRKWLAAGVLATLAAAVMAGDIDFSDLDDTRMRDMDDAVKELDATLGADSGAATLATASALEEGLAWVEKYFANKPEAPLGAGFAHEGREHVTALIKAVEAQDFDAAPTHLRAVVRSCKACHEAYKPPE
jgi:hypothetical protein